jgi:hypothetical protein
MGPRRHGPMAGRRFRHGFVRTLRPSHGWSQGGPGALAGQPASGSVSHRSELRYLGMWGPGGLGHLSGPRPAVPALQAGWPPPPASHPARAPARFEITPKAPAGNASGRSAGVPAPGQCDFIGPPGLLAATGQGLQAGATAPRDRETRGRWENVVDSCGSSNMDPSVARDCIQRHGIIQLCSASWVSAR